MHCAFGWSIWAEDHASELLRFKNGIRAISTREDAMPNIFDGFSEKELQQAQEVYREIVKEFMESGEREMSLDVDEVKARIMARVRPN